MGLIKRVGIKASVVVGSISLAFKVRKVTRHIVYIATNIRLLRQYVTSIMQRKGVGKNVDLVIVLEYLDSITDGCADITDVIGLTTWSVILRNMINPKDYR